MQEIMLTKWHKKISEPLTAEARLVFLAGPGAPGETPKETPKAETPAATGREAAAAADKAREAREAGDTEQIREGFEAEIRLRFASLDDYRPSIRESFISRFSDASKQFDRDITEWLKEKTLPDVMSTEGEIAKLVEKHRQEPQKLVEETVKFAASDVERQMPKGRAPSEINAKEMAEHYVSQLYRSDLEPAARSALTAIYEKYFSALNEAIQKAKQEIKYSKLTDEERKLYDKYKDLEGLSEKDALERLKDVTETDRQTILDVLKKMKAAEEEGEGVARDLKEGGFIGAFMGFIETLMKFINAFLAKLGIKQAETPQEGEARAPSEVIERNPLGSGSFVVTSRFGHRQPPAGKNGKTGSTNHHGIDVQASLGTVLHAGAKGTIKEAGENKASGKFVVIELPDKRLLGYAHLNKHTVRSGTVVEAGTIIGETGNSGASTGPHLHIALTDADGNFRDPEPLFKKYIDATTLSEKRVA